MRPRDSKPPSFKELRERLGVSQRELAMLAYVSEDQIRALEEGLTPPQSKTAARVAIALRVEPHELWPNARRPYNAQRP